MSWDPKTWDGAPANSFQVMVGTTEINVREVTGLKKEFDMIEVKTQTAKGDYVIRKIPGREKAVTITITRALTDDPFFDEWMNATKDGVVDRRPITVKVLTPGISKTAIKTYEVVNCQPSSVEITQMSAGATNTLDEKITLQGESIKVTPGG